MTHTIAIIPARMGSTRIPRKNLTSLDALDSYLTWAVRAAMHCTSIWISTDQDEIPRIQQHLVDHGITPRTYPHLRLHPRPAHLCTASADIRHATYDALLAAESEQPDPDWVVVLQPAVLLHSRELLHQQSQALALHPNAVSALTVTRSHPFVWQRDPLTEDASVAWDPAHYPRSQDLPESLLEINGATWLRPDIVHLQQRWNLPLLLTIYPAWAACLDIDTPDDANCLANLWPAIRPHLERIEYPISRLVSTLDGSSHVVG